MFPAFRAAPAPAPVSLADEERNGNVLFPKNVRASFASSKAASHASAARRSTTEGDASRAHARRRLARLARLLAFPAPRRKHVGSASRRSRAAAPTGASASVQAAAFASRAAAARSPSVAVSDALARARSGRSSNLDVHRSNVSSDFATSACVSFRSASGSAIGERANDSVSASANAKTSARTASDAADASRALRRRHDSPRRSSADSRSFRRETPSRVSSVHAAPAVSAASMNARHAKTRAIASSADTKDARRGIPSAVPVSVSLKEAASSFFARGASSRASSREPANAALAELSVEARCWPSSSRWRHRRP